ncbi:MAG: hypothetical protein V4534_06985 [Myxococcota bacterium]
MARFFILVLLLATELASVSRIPKPGVIVSLPAEVQPSKQPLVTIEAEDELVVTDDEQQAVVTEDAIAPTELAVEPKPPESLGCVCSQVRR